ncbi:MAG: thiol-disulfide oxidoreductase DCC family protein [Armatimonadota bacterium]
MSDTDPVPGDIVLFDGVCNLCDAAVRFIHRHDPTGRFRFAALQSPVGRALRERYGLPGTLDSIVLIASDQASARSTAALRIASGLRFPVRLLAAFLIVPASLRDPVYDWIARNRYRWFGRKDVCGLPPAGLRERFLPGGTGSEEGDA